MKNQVLKFSVVIFCSALFSCQTKSGQPANDSTPVLRSQDDTFSRFIPADTANKMLGSYLASIGFQQNDTDLQSLIIDADQLRRYLDSSAEGKSITHLKLMFAHTLAYANSPRANTNTGYSSKGLTLIIAGYNAGGNYVYYNQNMVLDYTRPCPPDCPPGNAGGAFLTH